jgi:hypothetical protein
MRIASAPPSVKAMVSAAGKKIPVLVSPVVVMAGNAAVPAWTVVTPVTLKVVDAVIAFAANVVFATVIVPVAAPTLNVVAAPPKFKVVAVALIKSNDVLGVVMLVVILGEVVDKTPAILAVVPTYSALATPTPPAVMIDPVVVLEESVVSVDVMPCANGMRAVAVV